MKTLKEYDITLQDLKEYLGDYERKIGDEYIWQCPMCNDSHKDNLKYNNEKDVLACFADYSHSHTIIKDITKKLHQEKKEKETTEEHKLAKQHHTVTKEEFFSTIEVYSERVQEELLMYQCECADNLLNHQKSLDYLYKTRGINKDTVEFTGMGIDLKLRKWVFPTFKYSITTKTHLIGFEYRNPDFDHNKPKKEIRRYKYQKDGVAYSMLTGLAMINAYTPNIKILVIVEGYIDGYLLWQFLEAENQAKYYHIITSSNGVGSLLKQLSAVNFSAYQKFYLYIDNDKAGNENAQKILERYPFFERFIRDCKDFGEWYLKNCK